MPVKTLPKPIKSAPLVKKPWSLQAAMNKLLNDYADRGEYPETKTLTQQILDQLPGYMEASPEVKHVLELALPRWVAEARRDWNYSGRHGRTKSDSVPNWVRESELTGQPIPAGSRRKGIDHLRPNPGAQQKRFNLQKIEVEEFLGTWLTFASVSMRNATAQDLQIEINAYERTAAANLKEADWYKGLRGAVVAMGPGAHVGDLTHEQILAFRSSKPAKAA